MTHTHQLRSAPPYTARAQSAAGNWTVERPGYGLVIALIGAVLAASGYFVLDWAAGTTFADIRQVADQHGTSSGVITQVYARAVYLPLLLVAVVTALCAPANRVIARVIGGVAGIAGGVGLIAVFVWAETGGVGTDTTRHGALPMLAVMALVGVGVGALGAGALFDTRAVLARSLAGAVAVLAIVLHVYVIEDVLASPGFGAWSGAIGYALLVVAVAIPYRRINHAS